LHFGGLEGSVLNGEATSLEKLLMESFDGFGGGLGGFEINVSETEQVLVFK
jgi:hypothetical protein